MVQNAPSGLVRQIAVKHDGQAMEAELNAMVDQGCTVLDVIVDHPIYGSAHRDRSSYPTGIRWGSSSPGAGVRPLPPFPS